MKLIAFCGSKGSGKSTSHEIFQEIYHSEVQELALAQHLKDTASKVFNMEMKYFIDPSLKEVELETYIVLNRENITAIMNEFRVAEPNFDTLIRPHVGKVFDTPRRLLQYMGTELLQPVDKLIHVKLMLEGRNPEITGVVTDLRFQHEFHALKEELGDAFLPVYVHNPKAEHAASDDPHPSERDLHNFKHLCYRIDNVGSLGDLREKLKKLISEKLNEKS